MNKLLKNLSISAGLAILIPVSSMAASNADIGYQSLESAKSALDIHLSDPSSSTDPFAISGAQTISYAKEQNIVDISDKNNEIIDIYRESLTTVFSDRNEWIDSFQNELADEIADASERKANGEDVDIASLYDDYQSNYQTGRLVEMTAIDDERSVSIVDILGNQSELSSDSVNAHRESVSNLLSAYNERRTSKAADFLDDDFTARLGRFSDMNERILPVVERAGLFSENCTACEMPVIDVIEFTPPIVDTPTDPDPIYLPPETCCGDYYRDTANNFHYYCP